METAIQIQVKDFNKLCTIYDNEGATLDRYTLIDNKTGDVYGLSDFGGGVNIFCFNIITDHTPCYGMSLINGIAKYKRSVGNTLGKIIKFEDLPNIEIKNTIKARLI